MSLQISLILGVVLTLIAFAFHPIRKTIGFLFIILGTVVSFRGGFIVGVPMIITGALLSLLFLLYHNLLDIF